VHITKRKLTTPKSKSPVIVLMSAQTQKKDDKIKTAIENW
jgi:hypothetical protein